MELCLQAYSKLQAHVLILIIMEDTHGVFESVRLDLM